MAVKVCVNGVMKQIDSTIHKPVIFLNGQKKVLDKAWIFINGEKKMLWGQPGVQLDYIVGNGLLTNYNRLVAIGETWATMAGVGSANPNVSRLNISNLSSPVVVQTVGWGYDLRNNTYLSDGNKLVFYGYNYDSRVLNRLGCSFSDGVVSVEKSYTTAGQTIIGDIGSSSIEYETLKRIFTQPQTLTRQYGTRFYVNGSSVYSVGHQPSSVSDGNYGPRLSDVGVQYSNSAWYGTFSGSGSYATDGGTWTIGTASASKVSSTAYNMMLVDGENIVVGDSAVRLVDKTSLSVVYSSETLATTGMTYKVIGRNGDYYYVVQYPSTAVLDGVVTLYLLDKDDLSTVYTQVLPTDPFNEYSGVSTFWNNCYVSQQVSGSGFLGVSTSGNAQFRIIRFSELL